MIDRPLYTNRIMEYVDSPFIKILTGIRRCGKSTILKLIMQKLLDKGISAERILSYRFDSMEYDGYTAQQMLRKAQTIKALQPNTQTSNGQLLRKKQMRYLKSITQVIKQSIPLHSLQRITALILHQHLLAQAVPSAVYMRVLD